MKRLKNITILLCFLSLLAFISCSAEDKTGINNPPEDTEITDGETGGSGGTGSGSGSGGGETENTETIESKDFPADLFGQYRDDKVASKHPDERHNTLFYRITTAGGTEAIRIKGTWIKDINTGVSAGPFYIKKWTKTTKGGKTIKLEGIEVTDKDSNVRKATVTYDYETKTLSGTYTDGTKATYLFNGKRIGDMPF